jgi:ATP-binding cassette, subfamily C (CFTR/MRP), member 1
MDVSPNQEDQKENFFFDEDK